MATRPGQLHLNAFLMGVGHHEAAWRLPESNPFAATEIQHYAELAQIAERGKHYGLARPQNQHTRALEAAQ